MSVTFESILIFPPIPLVSASAMIASGESGSLLIFEVMVISHPMTIIVFLLVKLVLFTHLSNEVFPTITL